MKDSKMAEESAKAMLVWGIVFTTVFIISIAIVTVSAILGMKESGVSEFWLIVYLLVALFVCVAVFTLEYCRYKKNQRVIEKEEAEEEKQRLIVANNKQ